LPVALLAVAIALGTTAYLQFRRRAPATQAQPLRSLATMRLQNLRQDPNSEFLSFSLADALITKLDYVSSLSSERPRAQRRLHRHMPPGRRASDANNEAPACCGQFRPRLRTVFPCRSLDLGGTQDYGGVRAQFARGRWLALGHQRPLTLREMSRCSEATSVSPWCATVKTT